MNTGFARALDFTVPCIGDIDIMIKIQIETALVTLLITLDIKGNLTSVVVKCSAMRRNLGVSPAAGTDHSCRK